MKNLPLLLLFVFNFCHSQSYSEKYNDLYKRYEYFNNQGKMIAYKYYDNLYKAWRYQELSESSQDSYISPVNTSRIKEAMASKQKRLDENVKKVQSSIDDIISNINEIEASTSTQEAILFKFRKIIKDIEFKNYDYSDNNLTRQIINFLYSQTNNVINTEISKTISEKKVENKKAINTTKEITQVIYTGYKKASYYSPITSEPTMNKDQIIAHVEYGEILILEKINDKYYKIKYKNIVGYIFEGWISE